MDGTVVGIILPSTEGEQLARPRTLAERSAGRWGTSKTRRRLCRSTGRLPVLGSRPSCIDVPDDCTMSIVYGAPHENVEVLSLSLHGGHAEKSATRGRHPVNAMGPPKETKSRAAHKAPQSAQGTAIDRETQAALRCPINQERAE